MKIRFATDFKTWLDDNRWKPKSLAEKLGVQRQSVHNWMEGKSLPTNHEVIERLYRLGGDNLLLFANPGDKPRIPKSQFAFKVQGKQPLKGQIRIPGSKNGCLPMMCAALLTKEKCTFRNVPDISDVELLLSIFEFIGASVIWDKTRKIVEIEAKDLDPLKLKDCPEIRKMRAAILVFGPLLARFGKLQSFQPGGCVLGARSSNVHLDGLRDFGAQVSEDDTMITAEFSGKQFKNTRVLLPEASVTGTANLAMFAAGINDECELYFTATETHVTETLNMLQKMGAWIEGIGSHRLKIRGTDRLRGVDVTIPSDYLLAGTYAIAGVLTSGNLEIQNVNHTEMLSFYAMLKKTGAQFSFTGDTLRIEGDQGGLQSVGNVKTAIFPGFPTDLQSPFGVLLTQCDGESIIFETLFENRLTYLSELEKMGAKVHIMNAHQAMIKGKTPLKAAQVQSWDIRAGAAMVLAGLVAEGVTMINNISYIDRGYEKFDENLVRLGAKLERIELGLSGSWERVYPFGQIILFVYFLGDLILKYYAGSCRPYFDRSGWSPRGCLSRAYGEVGFRSSSGYRSGGCPVAKALARSGG
ncbi:MAG TPA: UDP-N-acetylglucosamine 1-carboxyvinyltransferase [Candidatus Gracilibacteria bacterium]